MKVSFITTVVNRPDFVEIQYLLFKKYCLTDFDFYVVDDSHSETLSKEFKDICDKYGIFYIKKDVINSKFTVGLSGNNPNDDCAHAIQWTYDEVICKKIKTETVILLDSDMFLIDYLNPSEYMEDYTMCGLTQLRMGYEPVIYIWNGLMFFNMTKMSQIKDSPDFWCGVVSDALVDVGGQLHHFIKNNNVRYKDTKVSFPDKIFEYDVRNLLHKFEFHGDKKFLHFRSGTNWHLEWRSTANLDPVKQDVFSKIINEYLNG